MEGPSDNRTNDRESNASTVEHETLATTASISSLSEANDGESAREGEGESRPCKRIYKILFGIFVAGVIIALISVFFALYSSDYSEKNAAVPASGNIVPVNNDKPKKESAIEENVHSNAPKEKDAKDDHHPSVDEGNAESSPEKETEGDTRGSDGPIYGGVFDPSNQEYDDDDDDNLEQKSKCIDITIIVGEESYKDVKIISKTNRSTYYVPLGDKHFCSVKIMDKTIIDGVGPEIVKTAIAIEDYPEISLVSFYSVDVTKRTRVTQFLIDNVKNTQGVCPNYMRLLNDLLSRVSGK
ncbi:hypothetical protein BEWA_020550 [Theileria equi strain WA]|uniref:Uncharacterized protein n=1 Tax=Theileria equi strain WA TaxID=1537102 RepID=L0AVD4_THEEQ|nr:hypothetical protein BEWA_020550 [Theileria equi strain WA]AFZ79208.1 hypothetical protein BEWA_020550 [Theileria equi strain WA]|eukprot:XP_004828874.1 hypothetical protein BEWA_020550 [Theileria equi strain WA]